MLVKVRAASVNIAEWYSVTGRPWIARPTMGLRRAKDERLGVDYAGTVEAVGKDVTEFAPGDEVFGGRDGAYADYVCVREERAIVPKPPTVTFEQAAALGTAALTALQGLRDKGGLEHGQKVLIHGASGGVGTYAVQIAKALGAHVTAVCSTPNVEIAQSLGADRVVDYTQDDFTRDGERYDLVLDVAGTRPCLGAQARARARRHRRGRGRAEGEPPTRSDRPLGRSALASCPRQPEGRLLPRQVRQG